MADLVQIVYVDWDHISFRWAQLVFLPRDIAHSEYITTVQRAPAGCFGVCLPNTPYLY